MRYAAKASQNLGLTACPSFSGALLWHTFHPWPHGLQAWWKKVSRNWPPLDADSGLF
jgi:hypothetical protein